MRSVLFDLSGEGIVAMAHFEGAGGDGLGIGDGGLEEVDECYHEEMDDGAHDVAGRAVWSLL